MDDINMDKGAGPKPTPFHFQTQINYAATA
jgi:hypothetical protein